MKTVKQKIPNETLHIIKEVVVLFCTFVGVVVSGAFIQRSKHIPVTVDNFLLDMPNLIISSIAAFIYYGLVYTDFKFKGKEPPLIKRMASALLAGIASRTLSPF